MIRYKYIYRRGSSKSTHNVVSFGSKIRKLGILLENKFFSVKVGIEGVYISRTSFPGA